MLVGPTGIRPHDWVVVRLRGGEITTGTIRITNEEACAWHQCKEDDEWRASLR